MSYAKKSHSLLQHGVLDLCFGILMTAFPFILMKNFIYAFSYIFVLTSISSLNVINIAKRISPLSFSTSLINLEETKPDKLIPKKIERKEFSVCKCISVNTCGVFAYYIISVLFGAPLYESYPSTLYFSSLMVVLSVYPLMWYFYFADSVIATIRIFLDVKLHNVTESHLHAFAVWAVIGSWVGAFPIPLDWDRPWQTWPITCCVGATIGFAAAHLYMGCKLLHIFFKDSRKLSGSRQV